MLSEGPLEPRWCTEMQTSQENENQRLREKLRARKLEVMELKENLERMRRESTTDDVVEVKTRAYAEARQIYIKTQQLENENETLKSALLEAEKKLNDMAESANIHAVQVKLLLNSAGLYFQREFDSIEALSTHMRTPPAPVAVPTDRKYEVLDLERRVRKLKRRLTNARYEYERALVQIEKQMKAELASLTRECELKLVKEVADREECERQIEELKKKIPKKRKLTSVLLPSISILENQTRKEEANHKTQELETLEKENKKLKQEKAEIQSKDASLVKKAREKIVNQKGIIEMLRKDNAELRCKLKRALDVDAMKELKIARLETKIRYARPPTIPAEHMPVTLVREQWPEEAHVPMEIHKPRDAEKNPSQYETLFKELSMATFGRVVTVDEVMDNPEIKDALFKGRIHDEPHLDERQDTSKDETINEQQAKIAKMTSQISKLKKLVASLRTQSSKSSPSIENYEEMARKLHRKCRKQRKNIHELVTT